MLIEQNPIHCPEDLLIMHWAGAYSLECVEGAFYEVCLDRSKLYVEAKSRCRNRRSPTRCRSRQRCQLAHLVGVFCQLRHLQLLVSPAKPRSYAEQQSYVQKCVKHCPT
jgi:hypothetical protein